jgi:hypothetical protein
VVSALVRRNCGHYVENTGDADLVFIETFRSDHYEEVSLANWLSHLPPKLVSAHLNIPEETLATFPRGAGNRAAGIVVCAALRWPSGWGPLAERSPALAASLR